MSMEFSELLASVKEKAFYIAGKTKELGEKGAENVKEAWRNSKVENESKT